MKALICLSVSRPSGRKIQSFGGWWRVAYSNLYLFMSAISRWETVTGEMEGGR